MKKMINNEWLKQTWTAFTVGVLALSGWAVTYPLISLAQSGGDWRVHPRWERRANPEPLDVSSVLTGATTWEKMCVNCHGTRGRGDGPAGSDLSPRPVDLTDPAMWEQSDGALAWKILEGRAPMPGFRPALSEKEVWQVVHYIRTLAPRPPESRVSAEVREAFSEVVEAYFDLVPALADGEVAHGDVAPVRALNQAIGRLAGMEGDAGARERWGTLKTKLQEEAKTLREAADKKEIRAAFAALSETLAGGVESFGHAHKEPVIRYGCAEALEGKSATWLAMADREPKNPYYKNAGSDCAQPLRTLTGFSSP